VVFEGRVLWTHGLHQHLLVRYQQRIYDIAEGGGSTFPNINGNQIRDLKIGKPGLVEQMEIAATLTASDTMVLGSEARSHAAGRTFKAMLEELMTGRLSAVTLAP